MTQDISVESKLVLFISRRIVIMKFIIEMIAKFFHRYICEGSPSADNKRNTSGAAVIASIVCIIALLLIPTGFEDALQFKDAIKCKAKIISVDDSRIVDTGLIRRYEGFFQKAKIPMK